MRSILKFIVLVILTDAQSMDEKNDVYVIMFGANINPRVNKFDDNQWGRVAMEGALFKDSFKKFVLHRWSSYGFEGEMGDYDNWIELRFYKDYNFGLATWGRGYLNNYNWYTNTIGVSAGPFAKLSTKSLLDQRLGIQLSLWNYFGYFGGLRFESRFLVHELYHFSLGMMFRLGFPLIH